MITRRIIQIGLTNANGLRRGTRGFLSISSAIRHNYNHHQQNVQSQCKGSGLNPLEPFTLDGKRNGVFLGLQRSLSVNTDANPSAEQSAKPNEDGKYEEKKGDEERIKDDQTRVLQAALAHVPKKGWTEAAMVAGARDVGLSPSIVGVFPRKEAALVEYFMDDCLQRLLDEIESHEEELSNMVLHDRIAKLIRIRLEMQAPFISKWAQALSIQANPLNIPTSFKQRAALMDEIWHAAGDRSTDIDWYAKRTLLGGIYTATELYMLTDYSPELGAPGLFLKDKQLGEDLENKLVTKLTVDSLLKSEFRDTWTFLDRRIRDAFDCRKTAQEATQLASAIAAGLGNTLQAFLRRQ